MSPRRSPKPKGNYAFIDSQNLNLGIQKMGWKMDWRKFRQWLFDQHGVTNAYMFIGYMPNYEELYEQMHNLGYLIVLKPTLEMYTFPDAKPTVGRGSGSAPTAAVEAVATGSAGAIGPAHSAAVNNDKKTGSSGGNKPEERTKPAVKGNIDAELVLYAMKEIPNYNKAIIVSGDGDFYCLAEYLDQQNKLLHIMAPNRQYSTLLRPYEKYVLRLDTMRRTLAYRDFKRRVTSRSAARPSARSTDHAPSQTGAPARSAAGNTTRSTTRPATHSTARSAGNGSKSHSTSRSSGNKNGGRS